MVPRGGHCKSCKEYTLWGDVVHGCYRRIRSDSPTGHQQLSDNPEVQETKSSLRRKKSTSPTRRRKSSKGKEKQGLCSSSTSMPRRSRKSLSPPTIPSKGSRKQKQTVNSVFTTEGDNLDFVAGSEIEDNATLVKRKRGRPRKDLAILSPGASSSVSSPHPLKASRKPKKNASPTKLKLSSKGKGNRSSSSYQPAKATIRKKSNDVTPTNYRKKKANKSEPCSPISLITSSKTKLII
jgi:hypothetical protein